MEKVLSVFSAIGLSKLLLSAVLIFLPTLGAVYLLGRMLGIARTPRMKNSIAFLAMTILTIWRDYLINGKFTFTVDSLLIRLWEVVVIIGCVIILYVLVGFRLFSRIDKLMDKKVGEDDINSIEQKENDIFFPKKPKNKKK